MAWTTTVDRSTNDVVTAAIWNENLGTTGNAQFLYDNRMALVYKAADEVVNNSTTFQNDDHLSFSVEASSTYLVMYQLSYIAGGSPGTAADFKHQWTVPAGATAFGMRWYRSTSDTETQEQIDSLGSLSSGSNDATLSTYVLLIVDVSSTAGTMQLQWAQNSAQSEDMTLKKGSWVLYRKMS